MAYARFLHAILILCSLHSSAQKGILEDPCRKPSTIIVFRPFNLISLALSYKLFAGDSLLGRMHAKDVYVIESDDSVFSLYASIKAPSLNASRRSNYTKVKKIQYRFSTTPGQIYLVKCGFLNQNVFDHPRQPTIRLLKTNELKRYVKRGFIKRKLRRHLLKQWLLKNVTS